MAKFKIRPYDDYKDIHNHQYYHKYPHNQH